jgi:nucleoside-diphosphate-sugar epimerase
MILITCRNGFIAQVLLSSGKLSLPHILAVREKVNISKANHLLQWAPHKDLYQALHELGEKYSAKQNF